MHDINSLWSYSNPTAAYLFLLIPFSLLLAWMGWIRRQRSLQAFGDSSLRRQFQGDSQSGKMLWRMIFLSLAGIWTILALMNPFEEVPLKSSATSEQTASTRMNQEVWILLDTSASMGVRDEKGGESRLDVAKKTAEELLRLLPGRPISLYTFTSRADLLVPLTWDRLFVQLTLQNLTLDQAHPGGTDLAVLFDTINKARAQHRFFANSALILLTDGGDTTWESAKGEARQQRLLTLRAKLPQEHAALFAVGVGSAQGGVVPDSVYEGQNIHSKLDTELLQSLITPSDRLFFSQTDSPYQLAKELKEGIDRTLSYEIAEQRLPISMTKTPRFTLPLLLAILSLLAALAIPGIPTQMITPLKRPSP